MLRLHPPLPQACDLGCWVQGSKSVLSQLAARLERLLEISTKADVPARLPSHLQDVRQTCRVALRKFPAEYVLPHVGAFAFHMVLAKLPPGSGWHLDKKVFPAHERRHADKTLDSWIRRSIPRGLRRASGRCGQRQTGSARYTCLRLPCCHRRIHLRTIVDPLARVSRTVPGIEGNAFALHLVLAKLALVEQAIRIGQPSLPMHVATQVRR